MKVKVILLLLLTLTSCKQRDRGEYNSNYNNRKNIVSTPIETSDKVSTRSRPSKEVERKSIDGKVVRIIDGDTFVLLLDNDFDTGVRLNGIDCPERKQAFSQRAKKELSELIFNKQITVYYDKKDGFGRVLGDVYVNETNINHEMVRKGMAWHYVKYSDDEILAGLEMEARKNKVGLWAEPNPVPPWEYRSK